MALRPQENLHDTTIEAIPADRAVLRIWGMHHTAASGPDASIAALRMIGAAPGPIWVILPMSGSTLRPYGVGSSIEEGTMPTLTTRVATLAGITVMRLAGPSGEPAPPLRRVRIVSGRPSAVMANAGPGRVGDALLEVLALVAEGLRNAQIAERLIVARKTVDHHVSAILRKLDAPTRGQAAATAIRLGLLEQDQE